MQEQLISLETAKLACEKGFTENVDFCYDSEEKNIEDPYVHNIGDLSGDDELYAPTQSLLQKWLREVHNIHINVNCVLPRNNKQFESCICKITTPEMIEKRDLSKFIHLTPLFFTYEEALEEGLQTALNLLP